MPEVFHTEVRTRSTFRPSRPDGPSGPMFPFSPCGERNTEGEVFTVHFSLNSLDSIIQPDLFIPHSLFHPDPPCLLASLGFPERLKTSAVYQSSADLKHYHVTMLYSNNTILLTVKYIRDYLCLGLNDEMVKQSVDDDNQSVGLTIDPAHPGGPINPTFPLFPCRNDRTQRSCTP